MRELGTISVAWLVLLQASFAADCVTGTQQQALRQAAIVFRGKVVRIQPVGDVPLWNPHTEEVEPTPAYSEGEMLVTFQVDRGWKGPVTRRILVDAIEHPLLGSGYHFRIGVEYIVYAVAGLNQDLPGLRRLRPASLVYALPTCSPRVRTDIRDESRRLGPGYVASGIEGSR